MEKLKLEHLAPYLPYGLKVMDDKYSYFILSTTDDTFSEVHIDNVNGLEFKPILRPLSDITKEIELNGKKFVPINILRLMYEIEESYRIPLRMYIDGNYTCEIIELPYDLVSRLFEWHFDVFGLIDKGLAIDINEL